MSYKRIKGFEKYIIDISLFLKRIGCRYSFEIDDAVVLKHQQ